MNLAMRSPLRHVLVAIVVLAPALNAQVAHPGISVRVRAPGVLFDRFEGVYLGRAGGDTLLFGNDERGPVRVPAAAITRLDLGRGKNRWHGALVGALWGAGIIAALGAISAATDTAAAHWAEVAFVAVGGAEVGAITGAIVGRRTWVRAQPTALLNSAAVDDRRRLTLRLAIVR